MLEENPNQLQDQSRWVPELGRGCSASEMAKAQTIRFNGELQWYVLENQTLGNKAIGKGNEVTREATGSVVEYNRI